MPWCTGCLGAGGEGILLDGDISSPAKTRVLSCFCHISHFALLDVVEMSVPWHQKIEASHGVMCAPYSVKHRHHPPPFQPVGEGPPLRDSGSLSLHVGVCNQRPRGRVRWVCATYTWLSIDQQGHSCGGPRGIARKVCWPTLLPGLKSKHVICIQKHLLHLEHWGAGVPSYLIEKY